MMHLRDRLKIKAIWSSDAIDWNNFKRARNNVNNAIKNAENITGQSPDFSARRRRPNLHSNHRKSVSNNREGN